MITRLGTGVIEWARTRDPWTNVYGIARTLLAAATALTLLFNPPPFLFVDTAATVAAPYCGATFQRVSLFCVAPSSALEITRWCGFAICLVVLTGWRPRITGVLHWWVAHSLFVSASTVDGGDQAAAVLTLLLLPAAWTDDRKWHWMHRQPVADPLPDRELVKRVVAGAAMLTVRLQVAAIYLHAATGKTAVREWTDGTAMYYWLIHPTFGVTPMLRPLVFPLLLNPFIVGGITWSVVILEFFLMAGLLANRRSRAVLLSCGVALHLGILVLQGLVSFSMTMIAALIIYLRPWDEPFGRLTRVWERVVAGGDLQMPEVPAPTRSWIGRFIVTEAAVVRRRIVVPGTRIASMAAIRSHSHGRFGLRSRE